MDEKFLKDVRALVMLHVDDTDEVGLLARSILLRLPREVEVPCSDL